MKTHHHSEDFNTSPLQLGGSYKQKKINMELKIFRENKLDLITADRALHPTNEVIYYFQVNGEHPQLDNCSDAKEISTEIIDIMQTLFNTPMRLN